MTRPGQSSGRHDHVRHIIGTIEKNTPGVVDPGGVPL